MTIHERIEQARRNQFYDWIGGFIMDGIPLLLKVGALVACAWVLCGMCPG